MGNLMGARGRYLLFVLMTELSCQSLRGNKYLNCCPLPPQQQGGRYGEHG
jgi:hypothetical protein